MSGRDWEGERRGVKGCGSEMLGEGVGKVYTSVVGRIRAGAGAIYRRCGVAL